MDILIGILLVFMAMGAIIALETTDLLSAVVSLGAMGAFSSIIFLFVGAPDIAITQMVAEILSLVILIRATISRDLTTLEEDRDFFGLVATLTIIFVLLLLGIEALRLLPPFGTPIFTENPLSASNRYLNLGLKETGTASIINAISLDYRGYDTLGETAVLFTAILGALAILRVYAKKKR